MSAGCVSLEPFVLQVRDDSMAPDFPAGTIIVVEPGEPAVDGCAVVVEHAGGVVLRRLRRDGDEVRFEAAGEPDLTPEGDWRRAVRGVVVRSRPPRRASRPGCHGDAV